LEFTKKIWRGDFFCTSLLVALQFDGPISKNVRVTEVVRLGIATFKNLKIRFAYCRLTHYPGRCNLFVFWNFWHFLTDKTFFTYLNLFCWEDKVANWWNFVRKNKSETNQNKKWKFKTKMVKMQKDNFFHLCVYKAIGYNFLRVLPQKSPIESDLITSANLTKKVN